MDRTPDDGPTGGHSAHEAPKEALEVPEESADANTQGRETTGLETFKSVDDFVEAISGERPSDDEHRELDWYRGVRDGLRALRNAAELNQGDLADELGVRQSEVSRIETTLGPGTRSGRIREFAKKCGAHTLLNFERSGQLYGVTEEDNRSRRRSKAATLLSAQTEPSSYFVPPHGSVPGTPDVLFGSGAKRMFESSRVTESESTVNILQLIAQIIPALDRAMSASGISEVVAQQIRQQFLDALESQARTVTEDQASFIQKLSGASPFPSDVHVRLKETKEEG